MFEKKTAILTSKKRRIYSSVYVISPQARMRRSSSTPDMIFPTTNKDIKLDMKLEYSLDLKFENILNANPTSPTIIILPSDEYTLSRRARSDGLDNEDSSLEVSILHNLKKLIVPTYPG